MTTAIACPVRAPQWILTYAGVGISADISPLVLSITYTDRLGNAAGDLEIDLEDSDGRWQGLWSPTLGDELNLLMGYANEQLLPCGDFQVDELELSGPPDVMHLRCLATFITPAMRTANSIGYENMSLTQIAQELAGKFGLTLVTAGGGSDPVFERITQKQETDLAFLSRIATEYGYEFTVRGSQLVFYQRPVLESQTPVMTIQRSDLIRFRITTRTRWIYRSATAAYFNPDQKRLISQAASDPEIPVGDTIKLIARCENGQQAGLRAKAALHRRNTHYLSAELLMPGTTQMAAGVTVALAGFGVFDGAYLVDCARHHLTRDGAAGGGYTTSIETRRVS